GIAPSVPSESNRTPMPSRAKPIEKVTEARVPEIAAAVAVPLASRTSPWKHPPKEANPKPTPAAAATSVATRTPVVATAAEHAWPKWFWPGVAATLIISVLILAGRLILSWSIDAPPPVAVQSDPTPAVDDAAPIARSNGTKPDADEEAKP